MLQQRWRAVDMFICTWDEGAGKVIGDCVFLSTEVLHFPQLHFLLHSCWREGALWCRVSLSRAYSLSLALLLGDRQKSIVNRKSACPSVVCLCIALTRLQSTALQQRLPRLRVSDAASNSSLHFCLSTFAVFIDFSRVLLGILRRLLQRTHRIGGGSRQPRQQQRQSSRSAAALS